jgi:hypothetical protein
MANVPLDWSPEIDLSRAGTTAGHILAFLFVLAATAVSVAVIFGQADANAACLAELCGAL